MNKSSLLLDNTANENCVTIPLFGEQWDGGSMRPVQLGVIEGPISLGEDGGVVGCGGGVCAVVVVVVGMRYGIK